MGSCRSGRLGGVKALFGLVWCGLLTVALPAAERNLVIDPALSRVEIQVKATVDSFVGRLAAYDARLTFDDAARRVTAAVFRFKFSDVKTGKADRDAQMNEWQQTVQHPEAVYTLTSLAAGVDGRLTATGTFRLHGVERTLVFPVAVTEDNSVVAIDGEVKLDTREFGLPVIRKFAVLKVDPLVTVRFHLQGPQPAN
jgi:polyisoprenoid-binding protein YceI